jgi:hypothetical protein
MNFFFCIINALYKRKYTVNYKRKIEFSMFLIIKINEKIISNRAYYLNNKDSYPNQIINSSRLMRNIDLKQYNLLLKCFYTK